jgi:transposase
MIKKPIPTTVPTHPNPTYFPQSGTAFAVRLLADRVNWLSVVDTIIPWDRARARISPSVLALMLVINVLSHRNPLYAVERWAETLPLALLWGDTVQASQFNDDALGRTLEDLAHYGPQLLATIGSRMQVVHPTLTDLLHSDTTAYSLMGDYPSSESGPSAPLTLTWGHSKDHRPDLKQIMAGVTMDAAGCVLGGQMLSGNTADVTWNKTWVDQLAHDFPEDFWKDKCYIADSALFSAETIERLRQTGMHWLGRLPARFALCGDLKTRAWASEQEAWKPLHSDGKPPGTASVYHVQTFDVIFLGEPARAFVYHSSALDKKKEHSLQRDMTQERARYDRWNKTLARKTFSTAQEAAQAASQLLDSTTPRWHTATPEVAEQTLVVRRRGRPKDATAPDTKQVYTITLHVTDPTVEVVQAERQRRATWILLTDRMTLDAQTVLDEYKGQHHNEQGFRWTKSPIHLGAFWLEKPERVAGLGYLLLLALQFARFMRAVVRAALQDQPPLELPHRRVTRPSDTVILEVLHDLDMRYRSDGGQSWYQWAAVRPYQRRILDALQIPIDYGFVWDASG